MALKKQFTTLLVCLLVFSYFPFTVFAVHQDNEISSPELVVIDGDEHYLVIPEEADQILFNSDDYVAYQIDEGVIIEGEGDEEDLIAPAIVETEILSIDDDGVEGETTITVDLEEAVELIEDEDFNLGASMRNIFSPKVYATEVKTSSGSRNDKTLGVRIRTTVTWKQYSDGTASVTKVTGGYTRSDTSIRVTSSSVKIGSSGESITQYRTLNLGTTSNWTKTNGKDYSFRKVPYLKASVATVGGATYTVNLARGNSRWSVTYQNVAWSRFNTPL